MEKEEQNLSNEESLKLITSMINTAKGNIQEGYVFFLIWGWLVIIASLLHYVFLKFSIIKHPEIAWSILIIGFFLSAWYGYKMGKKSRVKTYSDRIYGQIWLAFLISYFILFIFFSNRNRFFFRIVMVLCSAPRICKW